MVLCTVVAYWIEAGWHGYTHNNRKYESASSINCVGAILC